VIYLASPYTDRSNIVMENRYRMALEAAAELTKAGLCIYSPIVHFHPMACIYDMPRDFTFWETLSRMMIDCAEGFWVLKLSGWESSIGIAKESEYAYELGLEPHYLDWEDRSAWPK
jgi:hypothetical protein